MKDLPQNLPEQVSVPFSGDHSDSVRSKESEHLRMRYFHIPEDSSETSQFLYEVVLQLHPRSSRLPDEEQTSQCLLQKVYFLLKLPVSPVELSGLQTERHPCHSW